LVGPGRGAHWGWGACGGAGPLLRRIFGSSTRPGSAAEGRSPGAPAGLASGGRAAPEASARSAWERTEIADGSGMTYGGATTALRRTA